MSSRRIGNYQITDYIGSGGFGSVFKAEDTSTPGRVVAIKELHKKHTRNAVIKQRFFQEAVAMARLDHANLPRLFTFGEDNGSYYLVMEFLSGRQLSDELQNGPLPAASAITIMTQALEALSYAHRNGIIHRDLKPDNIMLVEGDSLRVKVLDFGIARMVGGENLTLAGEGFGTPAYMSPERLNGSTSDDPRIDIYSAGIILFEMLTGKAPFDSSASDPVIYWSEMRKQHESDPLPLDATGIPAEIRRVIARATAKRIEDRYQTADEMLAELKSISGDALSGSVDAGVSAVATRLFLTTVPAAAEVHVDDQLRGTSDAIRGKILIDKLAPGLHTVRVLKAGYSEYRINVALEEGRQTDLQVALQARATVAMPPADRTAAGGFDTVRLEGNEAKTALFVVESLPAGTTILIGSEEVARADEDGRATIKLAPGQHEIEAKAPTGETMRKFVTVVTQDTGSLKTIAMPVERTTEAKQASASSGSLVPENTEPTRMIASETEKPAKSKRMAAAAVVVLLLALAAVAYVVLRGPSRGDAQSDAVGDQASLQSNAASSNPSPAANQESVVAGQANANRAEGSARAQEAQNAGAEKQGEEKPSAEEKPPAEESSAPTPTPPAPVTQPSQTEAPPQEACLVVRVAKLDGSTVHRARVMMIVQPNTSSASILNPGKSPNGLWSQCGLAAGNRVRVVVMGPRGGPKEGSRLTRDVTLNPGKNSVEIQVIGLPDDTPDREPPLFPGRRRPRPQRP